MDVLLTEPPVSRSGDAAEGSDEEEVEEEVEEGERIHVSLLGRKKKNNLSSVKMPFLPGRFGSSCCPLGVAPPRLEEQRRAGEGGWMSEEESRERDRGCRAFLLLLPRLEARAATVKVRAERRGVSAGDFQNKCLESYRRLQIRYMDRRRKVEDDSNSK